MVIYQVNKENVVIVTFIINHCRGCSLLHTPSACSVLVMSCVGSLLEAQISLPFEVFPDGPSSQICSHCSSCLEHPCSIYSRCCHYVSVWPWKVCSRSCYRWTWVWYYSLSTTPLYGKTRKHDILFTDFANFSHINGGNDHACDHLLHHTQSEYIDTGRVIVFNCFIPKLQC